MKSIQNKGINLTAEDLKNRIADRKERYTKQQARREKLEQTMCHKDSIKACRLCYH